MISKEKRVGEDESEMLLESVVEHLAQQADEISNRLVTAYTDEIVDYRSQPEGFLMNDVFENSRTSLFTLRDWLRGEADEVRSFEDFRNSAVRRFRQGISVQALLHSYRLWGQIVWEEIASLPQCKTSPATGFAVAGEVMHYVNRVSLAVANSYLEEAEGVIQDRHLAERNALEELISAATISERVYSYLSRLGIDLDQRYCVILLHRRNPSAADSSRARDDLSSVRRLLPASPLSKPLVGLREEEIVVILPTAGIADGAVGTVANEISTKLDRYAVGVSRTHAGGGRTSEAYREASDAVRIARIQGDLRAYFYTDVLLQAVVDRSGLREAILGETVDPLLDYDKAHGSSLVQTLRVYILRRFNLTQTAAELNIRPNTVRYRLERIQELSGRNPNHPDDLVLLALGSKINYDFSGSILSRGS